MAGKESAPLSNQKITVLLIEDSPDYAKLVQQWLSKPRGDVEYVLNWTDSLAEGARRLAEGGISVILLDLNLPDSEGPATFTSIQTQAEGIPVVILSAGDDEVIALEMIQQGAENYLVKSACNAEMLARAIRYAVVKHSAQANRAEAGASQDQAGVIAVVGGKGGVGATTVACTLAAELRRRTNQPVLLTDLDVHTGLVAFLTGVDWQYSIQDAIVNCAQLDSDNWPKIVVRGENGLDIVCSPARVDTAELAPERLSQLLAAVRPLYRWIVLDLGRLNHSSIQLLEAVNSVLIVTTTSLPSLYQTKRTVEALQNAGAAERIRLIVNQIEPLEAFSQTELRKVFGVEVTATLPSCSRELHESCAQRRLPAEGSAMRREIARLVHQLTGLEEEKPRRVLEPWLSLTQRFRRNHEPSLRE
jgi:Flp pilus assembly CpaE family ATPase